MVLLSPWSAAQNSASIQMFGYIEGTPDASPKSPSLECELVSNSMNSKDRWIKLVLNEGSDEVFSIIFRDANGYRQGGYALSPGSHEFPIPAGLTAYIRDEPDTDTVGVSGTWFDTTDYNNY